MTQEETEVWKTIEGFPNYAISNLARVKNAVTGHIHKPGINGPGYYHVILRRGGKSYTTRVHVLVAKHFLGPRPQGYEIDHADGKLNNRWDKLEYVPPKINHDRKIARRTKGHKLSVVQVNEINRLFAEGRYRNAEIARMFGVTKTMIGYIKSGHSWAQDIIGTAAP